MGLKPGRNARSGRHGWKDRRGRNGRKEPRQLLRKGSGHARQSGEEDEAGDRQKERCHSHEQVPHRRGCKRPEKSERSDRSPTWTPPASDHQENSCLILDVRPECLIGPKRRGGTPRMEIGSLAAVPWSCPALCRVSTNEPCRIRRRGWPGPSGRAR